MQAILKNKDKGGISRRADPVGAVICAGRISRYLEEEHTRRSGGRVAGV